MSLAEAFSFQPNGLLDGSSSKDASLLPASTQDLTGNMDLDLEFNTAFELNGLLEPESESGGDVRGISSTTRKVEESQGTMVELDDTLCFEPNGLLSGGSEKNVEVAPKITASRPPLTNEDFNFGPSQFDTDLLSSIGQPPDPLRPKVLGCRNYDGKTVVLTYRPPQARKESPRLKPKEDGDFIQLLEVPFHRLMDQLAMEAANVSTSVSTSPNTVTVQSSSSKCGPDMWVDRYRPKKFTDLVGDERVNREAMAWVKEWDHCVFGRSKRKRKRESEGWAEKTAERVFERNSGEDPWHRPREKILLLSGPPGLGKTTLAHTIAKQAGYAVLEINASDTRSGSVIDDRIRPALESGRAMGSSLPACVIIDEIDGATGEQNGAGFINKLVNLTFDPPNLKKRLGAGLRKAKRPLMRPIICICNDLYASSLSKLRFHARIIRVNPPPSALLTKRLRDICEYEDLKAEARALTLLTNACQGDLRSCLNVLQGIKTRSQSVTEPIVRTSTEGVKQGDTTTQYVWSELLTPMNTKKARNLGLTEAEESKYISRLVRCIDGHAGGTDKVVLGMFEHYTTLHRNDTTLRRFEAANEWLSNYDLMSSSMRYEQQFGLLQYLSYSIAPLHHHLATSGTVNRRVDRPTAYWDSFNTAKSGEEVFDSLRHSVLKTPVGKDANTSGYRHLLGRDTLRTEFAPLLNRIISPPIRPVNRHLIKGEERDMLNRLVSIMVSLGLRFEQDRGEDGQLTYRLEPPIDIFTTYDGKRASDIAVSRYTVRHMIAAEIENVVSVRQGDVIEKDITAGARRGKRGAPKDVSEDNIDIADRPAVDFFGRLILEKSQKPGSERGASDREPLNEAVAAFRLSYKYNEGNSCAIRKPTKMTSFL